MDSNAIYILEGIPDTVVWLINEGVACGFDCSAAWVRERFEADAKAVFKGELCFYFLFALYLQLLLLGIGRYCGLALL